MMKTNDGSKIPRNAYTMSRVSAPWGQPELRPSARTASLRLNGAGPKVIDPSHWPTKRAALPPKKICRQCQSRQPEGCGYCMDYDPATE